MMFTLALGATFAVPALATTAEPHRLPAACDPSDPETCLYASELSYDVGVVRDVSLVDPDRHDYEIPLLIRYPLLDTVEPRPVVIWNHGGAPSRQGATRSEEWGNLLAAAGYVVIHPARLPLADPEPLRPDCEANGILAPDECSHWIAQLIYGPQNTHFLIDHLDDLAALDPALTGLLDPELHRGRRTLGRFDRGVGQRRRPAAIRGRRSPLRRARRRPGRLPGHRRAGPDVRRIPLRVPARRPRARCSQLHRDRPAVHVHHGRRRRDGGAAGESGDGMAHRAGHRRHVPVMGHRSPCCPRDHGHRRRQVRHRRAIRPLSLDRFGRPRLPRRHRAPATRSPAVAELRRLPRARPAAPSSSTTVDPATARLPTPPSEPTAPILASDASSSGTPLHPHEERSSATQRRARTSPGCRRGRAGGISLAARRAPVHRSPRAGAVAPFDVPDRTEDTRRCTRVTTTAIELRRSWWARTRSWVLLGSVGRRR